MKAAAENLLIDLRRRGFSLRPDGEQLVVSPGELLTWSDRERIQESKADLLEMLTEKPRPPPAPKPERLDQCPHCRRQLDTKWRCWKCCDRRCGCGRMTGSAFLERCIPCERAAEDGNTADGPSLFA